MFWKKIDKLIGLYNFDPAQIALVERSGETLLIFEYSGDGAVGKSIKVDELGLKDAVIQGDNNYEPPFTFSINSLKFKFKSCEDGVCKGTMSNSIFNVVPIDWIPCTVKISSIKKLLKDINSNRKN